MDKKKRLELIVAIVERADKMNLLAFDSLSAIMDLKLADSLYNLDLNRFLNADNMNFTHDFIGIQNNIDRENKTVDTLFIPRYSNKIEVEEK
ncbi:TPA: hypothetical protein QFM54_002481 [Enterococcus faecium]